MELLQSEIKTDKILVDFRPNLYYNKYKYRARYFCRGITLAWFHHTIKDVIEKVETYKRRYQGTDPKQVIDFYHWKEQVKKNKTATIRIEGDIASVFSNDLELLKTLEQFGCKVDYTVIDQRLEEGVKYFVNQPEYKHRIYFRAKRITNENKQKLKNFFDRYENTNTVMKLSNSFQYWLNDVDNRGPFGFFNNQMYLSSSHFVQYNEESILTLISLSFPGLIGKVFKLEKRPDTQ